MFWREARLSRELFDIIAIGFGVGMARRSVGLLKKTGIREVRHYVSDGGGAQASRLARESVRDPTGSPVAINVSPPPSESLFRVRLLVPLAYLLVSMLIQQFVRWVEFATCVFFDFVGNKAPRRRIFYLIHIANYFRCNYLDNDSDGSFIDDRKLSELLSSSHPLHLEPTPEQNPPGRDAKQVKMRTPKTSLRTGDGASKMTRRTLAKVGIAAGCGSMAEASR